MNEMQEKLSSKVRLEYDSFISDIQNNTVETAIESAYEIVWKDSITLYFEEEDLNLSDEGYSALSSAADTLDEIYKHWENGENFYAYSDIGTAVKETAVGLLKDREQSEETIETANGFLKNYPYCPAENTGYRIIKHHVFNDTDGTMLGTVLGKNSSGNFATWEYSYYPETDFFNGFNNGNYFGGAASEKESVQNFNDRIERRVGQTPAEFEVKICEKLEKTVYVSAVSWSEAKQIIEDRWKNGEYILDSDNFTGVTFEAKLAAREHENVDAETYVEENIVEETEEMEI